MHYLTDRIEYRGQFLCHTPEGLQFRIAHCTQVMAMRTDPEEKEMYRNLIERYRLLEKLTEWFLAEWLIKLMIVNNYYYELPISKS